LNSHDTLAAAAQRANYHGPNMTAALTPEQMELAELIVSALNLEGVEPATIDPDAPLFGSGLALDSIDALELALEIGKRYGVQLKADDEDNKRIFSSLRALSAYVQDKRAA
jgi:acyl carrier protein